MMCRHRSTGKRTATLDVDGHEVRVNNWFTADGPGRIVGTLTAGRGMYSDGELMVDPPAAGTEPALADTVDACHVDDGRPLRPDARRSWRRWPGTVAGRRHAAGSLG